MEAFRAPPLLRGPTESLGSEVGSLNIPAGLDLPRLLGLYFHLYWSVCCLLELFIPLRDCFTAESKCTLYFCLLYKFSYFYLS